METLRQDVRTALRGFGRHRGFAAAVIMTMALGIGANTAIFSVVHAVMLRPLPYADGDALVILRQQRPLAGVTAQGFSPLEMDDYRQQSKTLEAIVEYHNMWFILLGRGEPERVQTGVVSWNYFDLFGVRPLAGRTFRADDDKHGADAVLLLSYSYWRSRFGGDPGVVGQVFEMNDRPHTVIGVLPPMPQFPDENDVYMPVSACPFRSAESVRTNRNARMVQAFGRMRPGSALESSVADLAMVASNMQQSYPENYPASAGFTATALSLRDELTRTFRPTLLMLLGAAGFLLLIVCASVANLMLARLLKRERELAIRMSLGASRWRIVRQLLTESTLLAFAGGTVGLFLAWVSLDLLVALAEQFTTRAHEISLNPTVLLFTLAIGDADRHAGRRAAGAAGARQPGFGDSGGRTHRLRRPRQAAGCPDRGAGGGVVRPPDWRRPHAPQPVAAAVGRRRNPDRQRHHDAGRSQLLEVHERRAAAAVRVVADLARARAARGALGWRRRHVPDERRGSFTSGVRIQGQPEVEAARLPRAQLNAVSPGYFQTVGIPLLRGRLIEDRDLADREPVAVISDSMARQFFASAEPLGARLSTNNGQQSITIVGVVGDVRNSLDAAPAAAFYRPLDQAPLLTVMFLARTSGDPSALAPMMRQAVHAIDAQQPADQFRTLDQVRAASLAAPRLTATLIGVFAAIALVITAIGLAGVIAFSVNQRSQEFGVRIALGATRGAVLALVLSYGARLVLIGLAIGAAAALALSGSVKTLLFETATTDAPTYIAVGVLLAAVALAACLMPARRAAATNPLVVLKGS